MAENSLPKSMFGLLTLVAICAAGSSASGSSSSGGSPMVSLSGDARSFVDAHNAVRASVRMPAGYPGPWVPVPPVAWSDEVASSAQAWAEQLRGSNCKLKHSDTPYGENLAAGKNLSAAGAVEMWASEIKHYRYTPIYEFEIVSGHYTQVIWRKTTHIGCGRASCGGKSVTVCRYSPPGNRIGRAPY